MLIVIVAVVFALGFSVIVHEVAHGWVAYKLGDPTAKLSGRLTLNPINHIDPFFTILLPIITFFSFGFAFGGAKPVPYNPYNIKDPKYGELKVAISGPASNFALAIVFGIIARITPLSGTLKIDIISSFLNSQFNTLSALMRGEVLAGIFTLSIIFCLYNLLLMVFNLIPIPPLDGSKVLMAFIPYEWKIKLARIEPYGFLILIFLLMFGFFSLIWIPIFLMFSLFVGF